MKIKSFFLSAVLIAGSLFAGLAKAVCPVCVVAVGAGLGLSRWFGIDDTISSLWIGALLVSLSVWTVVWLRKNNWGFKYDNFAVPAAYYILTLVPLFYYGIAGHPDNIIFGIDKILFGVIAGSIIFLLGVWLHNFLKAKNNGKQFFAYQKVVIPVLILLTTSLILYTINYGK